MFRKGRKGVLKGINGLLMCGAGRAPGMAGPLLRLLESCKFGDGVVEGVLEDELPEYLQGTWPVKETPGGKN